MTSELPSLCPHAPRTRTSPSKRLMGVQSSTRPPSKLRSGYMLERRNRTRRAICWGLVVGALAGALYAALELAWLPRANASAVALALFGIALVLGALAGTLQGLLVAAVARAADALATSRLGRP